MKNILILILIGLTFGFNIALAQNETSSSGGTPSVQSRAEEILSRLNALQAELKSKKDAKSRTNARKIKSITQKLVRSVNSNPPAKCLDRLKVAMNDLYGLVSKLGQGIACGPPIIQPFLQKTTFQLNPDCILPDFGTDQLDETFVDLNPIYDDTQNLTLIDKDSNDIPDVCEGNVTAE